jgi:hypothetical protein
MRRVFVSAAAVVHGLLLSTAAMAQDYGPNPDSADVADIGRVSGSDGLALTGGDVTTAVIVVGALVAVGFVAMLVARKAATPA